ncbi:MAG TPA: hypothetical protein PLS03_05620, partial [Terrimicrobiaceae bacterium]|nr:hypothetical protein [Terrimicrobiaceae bacterium]
MRATTPATTRAIPSVWVRLPECGNRNPAANTVMIPKAKARPAQCGMMKMRSRDRCVAVRHLAAQDPRAT